MRSIYPLGLLAALFAGGFSAPALAQALPSGTLELNGRSLSVTAREMKALADVRRVLQDRNRSMQDKALATAERIAQGPDARHVLAAYRLEIANQRDDKVMRADALDILIASDLTTAPMLATYLSVRGGIAFERGEIPLAKALWTRLAAMKPDDPAMLTNLAQIHLAENDPAGALDLIQRVITGQTAAGKPVSEGLHRQWLSIANQAKQAPAGFTAALAMVRAYPSARNWRDALVVYRQLAQPQAALEIDLLRLMRAAGALIRPAEYQRLAQLLNQTGLAAEARKVIDEGLKREVLDPQDSLTRQISAEIDRTIPPERARIDRAATGASALARPDSLVGMGRFDQAIALYHAAIGTLAVNAGEANLRLGMALVFAGQRVEAERVFRALSAQPGGYGELASFWLVWLESQAAGISAVTKGESTVQPSVE